MGCMAFHDSEGGMMLGYWLTFWEENFECFPPPNLMQEYVPDKSNTGVFFRGLHGQRGA